MRAAPLLLGVLMLTVTFAQAAPGALPVPPADAARDAARDPAHARQLAGALLGAVGSGSSVAALEALLASQGIAARPVPVAAEEVPGAPADLQVPLGTLLAAAHAAERMRADAVRQLTPAEQERVLHLMDAPRVQAPAAVPDGVSRIATLSSSGPQVPADLEQLAAKVDLAELGSAALTILQAIDASAPALKAAQPLPASQAAPCPGVTGAHYAFVSCATLIVGDQGSNTYAPPAAPLLLVDLGGNDVYANNPATGSAGVQVVVDVAGNDQYLVSKASSSGGATATGIGVGALGVGVLADLAGNDVYSATASTSSPQPGPVAGDAQVNAMGFGAAGVGVLLDEGGVDRFSATAVSDGGAATVQAQGAGVLGVGALLNLGATDNGPDDAYTATATSTLHLVSSTSQQQVFSIGAGTVVAQGGSGLAGVGLMADAGGNDRYVASALGGVANAYAQGGAFTGAAVLVDAQGDDSMGTSAIGDTTLSLIPTDTNFCWRVTVSVGVGDTQAIGQGGAGAGAGLLVDGAGNDARTLTASSHAGAIAEARGTTACTNTATAIAASGRGVVLGQGGAGAGAALLVDVAGNDVNTLSGASSALARAISVTPGPANEQATATTGAATDQGQGYANIGAGLLLDATGNDRYAAVESSVATQVTSAGTVNTAGPRTQQVQGFGGTAGLGYLVDGDGTDTYTGTLPTAAGNNACWSNGGSGRGRDWSLLSVLPSVCA